MPNTLGKNLIGHPEISVVWQNHDIFKTSLYFRERYFIHVVIEQIIIFIDQSIEFLPRDKDRYPHPVKSLQNVYAIALKLRTPYENCIFRSRTLVLLNFATFLTTTVNVSLVFFFFFFSWTFMALCFMKLFLPDWHVEMRFSRMRIPSFVPW